MGFTLDDYEPVEERLAKFWKDHGDGRVITELLAFSAGEYVVRAELYRKSEDLTPTATGLAQETTSQSGVNKTSALENCETSAIGRALANMGYAAKGRVSREEMEKVERGSKPAAQQAQQRTPAAATPGSRDELIARLKKVLADDHPKKPLLSSMSDRQLEALAKSHNVTLEASVESPSPEGEGPGIERVDAGSSPEGDWEAHWTMIAEVAGTNVQQIENLLRTLPGGKSIQSLKNLSPHSAPGQKLEKALIGNKKESAA